MLATVLKYSSGNGQSVTNWLRYVNSVELRTSIYKTRFLMGPFVYSPFVNLCKQILHDIPVVELFKCKSDYSRFQQIFFMSNSYRNMFDPVYKNKDVGHLFTKGPTADYVLNVTRSAPMKSFPLDKPWKYWEELYPVRVLYHDSLELVTDLSTFSIEFKSKPASWMACSVDPILLIFKYLRFLEHAHESDDDDSIEAYLQLHVLPKWFDDLRNIWFFNILSDMLFDQYDVNKLYSDQTIAPLGMISTVTQDVERIQSEIQRKALRLGDVLATEWFGPGKSILGWIREIHEGLTVPDLTQYVYLKFLEEFPYTAFAVRVNNLSRSREGSQTNRELYQLLKRYNDNNIYSNLLHQRLREKMAYDVGRLLTETKQYQSY